MRGSFKLKVKYNNLDKVAAKLPTESSKVIRKGTLDIAAHAGVNTPVDTGYLKNSQEVEFENNGLTGRVSWSADYATHVHEGTRRMSARPFALQAVEKVSPSILEAFKQLESKIT